MSDLMFPFRVSNSPKIEVIKGTRLNNKLGKVIKDFLLLSLLLSFIGVCSYKRTESTQMIGDNNNLR